MSRALRRLLVVSSFVIRLGEIQLSSCHFDPGCALIEGLNHYSEVSGSWQCCSALARPLFYLCCVLAVCTTSFEVKCFSPSCPTSCGVGAASSDLSVGLLRFARPLQVMLSLRLAQPFVRSVLVCTTSPLCFYGSPDLSRGRVNSPSRPTFREVGVAPFDLS